MPKMSSETSTPWTRTVLHGSTMGTRWSVTVDADDTLDLAALSVDLAAAVERVDEQMSPWKPDSDLMRFNAAPVNEWVALPDEMLEVLEAALSVQQLSDSAFNPCTGALVDAWGFGAVRDIPDAQAIGSARQCTPHSGADGVELDRAGGRARKRSALKLDLCGIAKGYAVDLMVRVLQRQGAEHALAVLDGELRAVGAQANGAPWSVAVEHPEAGSRAVHGVLELNDLAVATSGDYRHYHKVGSARLAHTMDSRRCAPVNNSVASATVLAPTCTQADAWATALLVAGLEQGLVMAQRRGIEVLFLVRRPAGLVEVGLGRFNDCSDQANSRQVAPSQ
jgi:thiamine biosynthesis lipoprotein